jgi:hypothetical protein
LAVARRERAQRTQDFVLLAICGSPAPSPVTLFQEWVIFQLVLEKTPSEFYLIARE